jgi:hypothetical protein
MSKLLKIKDVNGRIIPKKIFWLAFIGVLLVCVVYIVIMFFIPVKVSVNMGPRGAFGDMFGALGALFSGLAFAGLIVTMLQQREDLQNQKDEIALQRDEIALQRKDLEAQTEALKLQKEEIAQTNKELQLQRAEMMEQNKTIMLQRFENSFFHMLSMQQSVLRDVVVNVHVFGALQAQQNEEYKGRSAIAQIFITLRKVCYNRDIKYAIDCCNTQFDRATITPYFQQIYLILDHVDRASWLTGEERYNYISILRTTFSKEELTLLFYYGLCNSKLSKFKELIETYALFLNLQKDSLFSADHYELYEKGAYEFIQSDPC